ncbi:hypothetical protein B0H14DRAFT_2581201 [Mycena olivaceomarginata]|nr:hypothetical protein B0H14DRAFT_2581201 [Mycena olivaceomarginata]
MFQPWGVSAIDFGFLLTALNDAIDSCVPPPNSNPPCSATGRRALSKVYGPPPESLPSPSPSSHTRQRLTSRAAPPLRAFAPPCEYPLPLQRARAARPSLARRHRLRCLRLPLPRRAHRLRASALCDVSPPRARHWAAPELSFDVLFGLKMLAQLNWESESADEEGKGVCALCASKLREKWETEREEAWGKLDELFQLEELDVV